MAKYSFELRDYGWNDTIAQYKKLGKKSVVSGFSQKDDESGHRLGLVQLVSILMGTSSVGSSNMGMSKWPFMQKSFDKRNLHYFREIKRRFNKKNISAKELLEALKDKMVSDIKREIVTTKTPRNAKEYAKSKGGNNPLIGKKSIQAGTSLLADKVFGEVRDELI